MTSVEGQAPKAVAEALGLTVGAVYHNKSRVMARLRQRIEQADETGKNATRSEPKRILTSAGRTVA